MVTIGTPVNKFGGYPIYENANGMTLAYNGSMWMGYAFNEKGYENQWITTGSHMTVYQTQGSTNPIGAYSSQGGTGTVVAYVGSTYAFTASGGTLDYTYLNGDWYDTGETSNNCPIYSYTNTSNSITYYISRIYDTSNSTYYWIMSTSKLSGSMSSPLANTYVHAYVMTQSTTPVGETFIDNVMGTWSGTPPTLAVRSASGSDAFGTAKVVYTSGFDSWSDSMNGGTLELNNIWMYDSSTNMYTTQKNEATGIYWMLSGVDSHQYSIKDWREMGTYYYVDSSNGSVTNAVWTRNGYGTDYDAEVFTADKFTDKSIKYVASGFTNSNFNGSYFDSGITFNGQPMYIKLGTEDGGSNGGGVIAMYSNGDTFFGYMITTNEYMGYTTGNSSQLAYLSGESASSNKIYQPHGEYAQGGGYVYPSSILIDTDIATSYEGTWTINGSYNNHPKYLNSGATYQLIWGTSNDANGRWEMYAFGTTSGTPITYGQSGNHNICSDATITTYNTFSDIGMAYVTISDTINK